MFDTCIQFIEHLPAFVGIMAQVVSIWGFLNFINQLNLQNKTAVADRALGRLPGLRMAIRSLDVHSDKDLDDKVENITEIYRKLFIDLKQLGIAKKYQKISDALLILVQKEKIFHEEQNFNKQKLYIIDLIAKLEQELMNIFDMSYAGQNFISHLSRNILQVTWISLVVYLIQNHSLVWAGNICVGGLILFQLISLIKE